MALVYQTVISDRLNQYYKPTEGAGDGVAVQVAPDKFARRAVFTKLQTGAVTIWSADITAPPQGEITGIAVQLIGKPATGKLYVSTVNPAYNYDGCFLYAVLNPIDPVTTPINMYRRGEIVGGGYNTTTLTAGTLYLAIVGMTGGDADKFAANVVLTVTTG
jgi:hypothetical protein